MIKIEVFAANAHFSCFQTKIIASSYVLELLHIIIRRMSCWHGAARLIQIGWRRLCDWRWFVLMPKHIAWHVHALCARFTLWDIGHRKVVYRWATGYYNHAHAIVSYRRPAHPNRSLITPQLVLGQPADEAHCMTCICMICMLRFMIQVRSKFMYTWITRSQDRNHRTHPHHYPTHPNHEPTAP